MSIRWINSKIGTAPAVDVIGSTEYTVIDVRDLVDKQGNNASTVKAKIDEGVASLKADFKTVICCDYGISRSNAIAAGVISVYENISLESAIRKVQDATGEKEIKLEPLAAVREALGSARKVKSGLTRTVLVTGGSGFVGQALLPHLRALYNVIAPTREQLDLEGGSTQLELFIVEHSVDYVVHLASPRVYTSNVALGSTLTMLRNVLDVCISQDIHLVYPSSWEVFSGYSGVLHASESLPAYPKGPYGDTKYLAEKLIELSVQSRGLKCSIIRSSPVYGEGSDKPKFIYNFIDKALRGEEIVTHVYKNGAPALDLMSIDDLVKAICLTVQKSYLGYFNIGTGLLTSTANVAQIVVAALGSTSEVRGVAVDSQVASISMDHSRADKLLGWRPSISFEVGLRQLIAKSRVINEQF